MITSVAATVMHCFRLKPFRACALAILLAFPAFTGLRAQERDTAPILVTAPSLGACGD